MHVFLVSQQYWSVIGRSRRTPRRAFSAHLDHRRSVCGEFTIYINFIPFGYKEILFCTGGENGGVLRTKDTTALGRLVALISRTLIRGRC